MPAHLPRPASRVLFLQMRAVHDYQARQFVRSRGCDDLPFESRSPGAAVFRNGRDARVSAGVVDGRGIETERIRILFDQFVAALQHAAVDKNALPRHSTMWQEPVTPRSAPWNESFTRCLHFQSGLAEPRFDKNLVSGSHIRGKAVAGDSYQ